MKRKFNTIGSRASDVLRAHKIGGEQLNSCNLASGFNRNVPVSSCTCLVKKPQRSETDGKTQNTTQSYY